MKACCAKEMIHEAVRRLKASDPLGREIPDAQFLFNADDVFNSLLKFTPRLLVAEATEALREQFEIEPCVTGTADPFVCGCTFILVVEKLYDTAPVN